MEISRFFQCATNWKGMRMWRVPDENHICVINSTKEVNDEEKIDIFY